MKTIRKGTFETNSSSMHAIVISRDYRHQLFDKIVFDNDIDFSSRTTILRNTVEDKAAYVLHILLTSLCKVMPPIHYSSPYSEEEVESIKKTYSRFLEFFEILSKDCRMPYELKNCELKVEEDKGFFSFGNEYASNGCYGHKIFNNIIELDSVISKMHFFLKGGVLEKDDLYCWKTVLYQFILNENSVIVQGTDECDDEEDKLQRKYIKDYVLKNEGDCYVDWPLGG